MQTQKRENQYTPDELATLETCLNFYKQLYPTPTELQSQLTTFMVYELHAGANTRSMAISILNMIGFLLEHCQAEPNMQARKKLMDCCSSLSTLAGFLVELKQLKLVP